MYLAAEHHLLFTFAGGGLRTGAINTRGVREQQRNKVRREDTASLETL